MRLKNANGNKNGPFSSFEAKEFVNERADPLLRGNSGNNAEACSNSLSPLVCSWEKYLQLEMVK